MLENGYNPSELSEHMDIYITGMYGSVTTLTTVGYGDVKGYNDHERVYFFFLIFVGILIFTYLVDSVTGMRQPYTVNKHLAERKTTLTEYMDNINRVLPGKDLNNKYFPDFYATCSTCAAVYFKHSAKISFESSFYKELPPLIQEKLVSTVLQ